MKIFESIDLLNLRSIFIQSIRDFLRTHNHLEIHSPILSSQLIPERHIEVYSVEEETEQLFLTPSPEIHLKHILSRLSKSALSQLAGIFEITHSFRKLEQKSPVHQREFLLLEFYSLNKDIGELQDFTFEMIQYVIQNLLSCKKHEAYLTQEHDLIYKLQRNAEKMTLRSILEQYNKSSESNLASSFDFMKFVRSRTKQEALEYSGIDKKSSDLSWEDIFHYLVLQYVEPVLPKDVLVFLHDYPNRLPTLAKKKEGTVWSCRWELYINAVEIANCYEEETDPALIKRFIRDEKQEEGLRTKKAACNPNFLSTYRLPKCSGLALGLDRLFYSLIAAPSLKECSTMNSDILKM